MGCTNKALKGLINGLSSDEARSRYMMKDVVVILYHLQPVRNAAQC